jgi:hypothetical protein
MDLPTLRHFQNGLIVSDPVEACVDGNWIAAVLCQRDDGSQYWATLDMAKLASVTEWRSGEETNQGGQEGSQSNGRIQAGDTPKRQARARQGTKGKKSQTGNSNCSI